jgi:hypothetical protein
MHQPLRRRFLPFRDANLLAFALVALNACGKSDPSITTGAAAPAGAATSGGGVSAAIGGSPGTSGAPDRTDTGGTRSANGGAAGSAPGSAGVSGSAGTPPILDRGDPTLPGDGTQPGAVPPACQDSPPSNVGGIVENDKSCWFEFNMPWDDASENVTNMSYLLDAPAGKHGYLKTDPNGHLFFEDQPGTRVRFNGVTITAGANFPDKDKAPLIAARLARFGVNLVRVTFQDEAPPWGWFKQPFTNTSEFDPERIDRLDWFLAKLKEKGIYVFFDFLAARYFGPGDGVTQSLPTLGQKIGTLFDRKLIDLQASSITRILTHVNPYTALAYKDDPVIPLGVLSNENALFLGWVAWLPDKAFAAQGCGDCLSDYYSSELDRMYNDWLRKKYGGDDAIRAAWGALASGESLASSSIHRTPKSAFGGAAPARIRDDASFYYEAEGAYLSELRSLVQKTLGSKMLVTMTSQVFGVASMASQAQGDFMSNNIYWHHPSFVGKEPGRVFAWNNLSMIADINSSQNVVARMSQSRIKGLPHIVSEFNYNFPSSFQVEAPGMMYAFMNFVGSDGLIWHAYHDFVTRTDATQLYGMFELAGNPIVMSQFVLAKPYLAGDLKEADAYPEVVQSEVDQWDTTWKSGWDPVITAGGPPLASLVRTPTVRSFFGGQTKIPGELQAVTDALTTGHGELYWNSAKAIFTINNAHWQGGIGYLKESIALNQIKLTNIRTTGGQDFAAVNLVSMDSNPIASSNWLLLTTAARVENKGQKWQLPNGSKISLSELGDGPILVEPVRGRIGLQLDDMAKLEVWALDARGNPLQKVATELTDGTLWFELGHHTLWYQIARRR